MGPMSLLALAALLAVILHRRRRRARPVHPIDRLVRLEDSIVPDETAPAPGHRTPPDLDVREVEVPGTAGALEAFFATPAVPGPLPRRAAGAKSRPLYTAQRPLLVRAAPHSQLPIPPWPDLGDTSPSGVRAWCTWATTVWLIPEVADAVRHVSPALARELDGQADQESPASADTARRLLLSLAPYVQRLRHRPDPLGLFAGVAEARFGDHAQARWGTGHRAVARADGEWLARIIQQLEDLPEVRHRLRLVASNVLEVRGRRLVLPWQPRIPGTVGTAVHEVSVRCTPAVRAAVHGASTPVDYLDLARKITAAVGGFEVADAQELLDTLLSHRILITSLQPHATEPDALGYLVAELRRSGTEHTEAAGGLTAALGQIHALMNAHNQQPATAGRERRSALTARMRQHAEVPVPLALDLGLDAELVLPRAVAWEAEAAAGALARTAPEPHGAAAWRRYRARFQARYGEDVLVPVSDLLDLDRGLGLPEDFHGTPRAPQSPVSRRDALLTALAQQAAAEERELVLDEDLIGRLAEQEPAPGALPPHTELQFAVHASSTRELEAGQFTLAVRRASRG
ncbi:lantibiotic dehydratase family protein, partial [Streptomyces sp. NPDC054796]